MSASLLVRVTEVDQQLNELYPHMKKVSKLLLSRCIKEIRASKLTEERCLNHLAALTYYLGLLTSLKKDKVCLIETRAKDLHKYT